MKRFCAKKILVYGEDEKFMNENEILNELILPYLESLGYKKSSIRRSLPIAGDQDIKVSDFVVYDNDKPYFVVEAKSNIPEKNDPELLKFHPYVRELQSQASTLNAPYYLLTDGFSFLWFTTDGIGRPKLLSSPVAPTSDRENRPIQHSKEAVIQGLRALQDYLLIRSGNSQSKDLSALFVMAKLLSERGDSQLKEQLLNQQDIYVDPTGLSFLNLFDHSYWGRVQMEQVFEILDGISFSSVPPRDLLSALDDILMNRRSRSNNQKVPHWLADFLVRLGQVKAQSNNVVLDIACGSGDILAAISLNSKEASVWGISSSSESTLWSQLQMVVLNQQREAVLRGRVPPYDILHSQRLPTPTHIITAPQFGVKIDWSDSSYLDDIHSQLYLAGVRQIEDIYLELAIKWVEPNGRIVMLVPEGMLFSGNRRQETRRFIMENTRITAIISLDSGALLPYSAIKTSILVLDKKIVQKDYDVFMARIDESIIGDRFQSPEIAQVSEVLNRFEQWTNYKQIEPDAFGWIVSPLTLKVENLTANRYLSSSISDSTHQEVLGRIVPLKQVVKLIKRGTNIKLDDKGTIPVIGPAAIRPMILDANSIGHTTTDRFPSQSVSVRSGDVLINNIGTYLGNAVVVSEDLANSYISGHVILIRPDQSLVLSEYLAAVINSDYVKPQLQQRATGSVMPSLAIGRLEEVTIPLPNLETQRKIAKKIKNTQEELTLAQHNLAKAESKFTNLIQKLTDEDEE